MSIQELKKEWNSYLTRRQQTTDEVEYEAINDYMAFLISEIARKLRQNKKQGA